MAKTPSAHPVRYHLRIQISSRNPAAQARRLWEVVRRAKIDEIMFFAPDAEECSPGLGTVEDCEAAAARLAPLFAKARKLGVTPSINIWWTVSFSNMPALPRNQRKDFDFRWAVSLDGKVSNVVACPRCEKWRAEVERVYATFARLKPARIWIDDDTRAHLKADLFSQCFCDSCLEEVGRRTGRKWGRDELFKAIMADPSEPSTGGTNPVRDTWMKFEGEIFLELVRGLARAVREASPETSLSLMFGGAETHFTEGRKYGEIVEALGSPRPYVRPGIGPYIEMSPVETAEGWANARREQALVPAGTVLAPELENYPDSRFRKSARLAAATLAMGQLLGMNEITVNVYPFTGRFDLEQEDIWERMLEEQKPFLQRIADLGITREQQRGVRLLIDEEVSRHVRGAAELAKPILMYRQRPWDVALPLFGMAASYVVGAAKLAEEAGATPGAVVLGAEQVLCLSDAELERVFAGGVVLDARAAEALVLRGRGDLAGVVKRVADAGASIETVEDKRFGGAVGAPMSVRYNGVLWQFELATGVKAVSRLRGYRGEATGHGVVLFENKLGGRVVVYPYDSQGTANQIGGGPTNPLTSSTFLHWARQGQLLGVLEWAGRRPVPLLVPEAPCALPLLVEQEGRLIVGVVNASPDPVEWLKLRLAKPGFAVKRVRRLKGDGKWAVCRAKIGKVSKGVVMIDTGVRLEHHDVGVVVVE